MALRYIPNLLLDVCIESGADQIDLLATFFEVCFECNNGTRECCCRVD